MSGGSRDGLIPSRAELALSSLYSGDRAGSASFLLLTELSDTHTPIHTAAAELPPAHRASPAVGANLCVVIVVENDENATVRGRVCGCEQDVHTPDECSETFQWPSPGSWPAGSWLAEISAFQYHVSRGVGGLSDTDAHDDVPSTKAMTQWGGELRTSLCTTPPPYCAHRGHCLWQNHGGPAPRQARGPCPRL